MTEPEFESQCYPIKGFLRWEVDNISTLDRCIFGNNAKVGKSEWCICLKTFFEKGNKYLGCFVMGVSHFEKGTEIPIEYTIQLVNQNQLMDYSKKESHTFERYPLNGWFDYIKWSELMSGGYVKNDKIIVEVYISIKSESTVPRRRIDFETKRPNEEDLKAICDNIQKQEIVNGKMKELVKVDQINTNDLYTDITLINGLECCFAIRKETVYGEEWLSVHICINNDDKSEWWGCEATSQFTVVNKKDKEDNKRKGTCRRTYNAESSFWGTPWVIEWDKLVDPKNGFVVDGAVEIEANVHFYEKRGIDENTGKGFEKLMKKMTDAIVKVGGTQFHVPKTILSQQSKFFNDLWTSQEDDYEVEDVDKEDFKRFLGLVHNQDVIITEDNLESLLKMVERFEASECFERIDVIRKKHPIENTMRILKLVDKYPLPELQYFQSQRTEEPEPTEFAFSTDFEKKTVHCDVKIEVNTFKYHASKQILANASHYFMNRFYGPQSLEDAEIKVLDVHPLQFETLLTHIYHPTRPVTCANVDSLLQLAKVFSVPRLMDKCEEYLVLWHDMPLIDKLEYA